MFKEEKGITLVALVVTIIILLILAGVTLTLVLNENGLINRARTASNTMANATQNETRQMEQFSNDVNQMYQQYVDSYSAGN